MPGAGVALGRAQRDARLQRAGGVEQRGAGLGQPAGVLAGEQDLGEQGRDVGAGVRGEHRARRRRASAVSIGEHARRVADAQHLAAGQPPVHVAGERGDEGDLRDVRLGVERRLAQVRDRPAQRDVVAEQRRSAPPRPGRWSCCARCGTGRAARRRRRTRGSRASSRRCRGRRPSSGRTPCCCSASSSSAATAACSPDQTASSEYVQTRSTNWFSQSWLPLASGAWSGPIRTALMRVEPSSMPSVVRPAAMASRGSAPWGSTVITRAPLRASRTAADAGGRDTC